MTSSIGLIGSCETPKKKITVICKTVFFYRDLWFEPDLLVKRAKTIKGHPWNRDRIFYRDLRFKPDLFVKTSITWFVKSVFYRDLWFEPTIHLRNVKKRLKLCIRIFYAECQWLLWKLGQCFQGVPLTIHWPNSYISILKSIFYCLAVVCTLIP